MLILTRILGKTFVVSDGRHDYTADGSIDWRVANSAEARRIMAAAMKTYASVFVQSRDIIYDASLILGEADDVQEFANKCPEPAYRVKKSRKKKPRSLF